ncbi:carboxymuconolactone decarboxylase family protein [Sphingomonas oligophenolica]|uniref:Carboxymuconolactone decarboxylase family protein n=1 Tax=Sphingomonas oligophenolica TaxID=301154 RepID=A0ABU9YBL7_9SPHN
MRDGFATRLNVYRVMAHHPALLKSWARFRDHVVLDNRLDRASLEIVILRTGFRRDSRYEWMQHVVRGRGAGLEDRQIKGAALAPEQAASATDALLMRCVDALIDTNRLPKDLQAALCTEFGKEGVLDLIATVGMYSLLAYMLESFETPIDADIAAALELDPLTT